MKIYVRKHMPYKFLPQSGRTDYDTLRFAFDFLEEGDYMIDNKGVIYEVLDPGHLHAGFLESYRIVEVKEVEFDEIPDKIKDAIYHLANSYPSSTICKKALEVAQQG